MVASKRIDVTVIQLADRCPDTTRFIAPELPLPFGHRMGGRCAAGLLGGRRIADQRHRHASAHLHIARGQAGRSPRDHLDRSVQSAFEPALIDAGATGHWRPEPAVNTGRTPRDTKTR